MSSLSISQANRPLQVTTPLGDALVAVSLAGEEEVSRPFLFVVDFVSTNASVSPGTLLGKAMTLHIPTTEDKSRALHGLVRQFSSVGRDQSDEFSQYRVEVVPALWFMSLSSDCRTFENMSALDIVEKVCLPGKQLAIQQLEQRNAAKVAMKTAQSELDSHELEYAHLRS